MLYYLSIYRVRLFATLWTVPYQAPRSMGFSLCIYLQFSEVPSESMFSLEEGVNSLWPHSLTTCTSGIFFIRLRVCGLIQTPNPCPTPISGARVADFGFHCAVKFQKQIWGTT